MKFAILLTVASMASAARLDQVYLPPHSAASGGANAGLQTPFASPARYSDQSFAASDQTNEKNHAEILKFENEMNEQGYRYAYESSDGTKAEQEGQIIPGEAPEEGSLQVSGSYSYIGDDGQTYTVTYTAGENGYQASGDHLPTPPPIPEAILKSLQLTASESKYNSQKSSYDADAGY
ncbi:endocuticle structural glycoprotein SgAbd-3-like [Epargyreus clarus]|uniref:endocuticle structural glycoprotein SgAbd-3-like n=1 Tax=Epargyreus clarus TaxID=520877 RepID=UPI003C2C603F